MALKLPKELAFLANNSLPPKKCTTSMIGKTCLIAGATSGVGYESALAIAKAGADIIILARNLQKAEKLLNDIKEINSNISKIYLADFTSMISVREAVSKIIKDIPKIDVLINSVGIFNTRKELINDYEKNFYVSHLSTHLMVKMLIPKLIESAPSRIIHVNSEGHRFGGLWLNNLNWKNRPYIGLRAYGAAKIAQIYCMREMDKELKNSGVTINCMHPGAVKTNIGNNNGFLYRFWLHKVMWLTMKTPDISGAAIYYLAAAPEMEGKSGKFYNLTTEEALAPYVINDTKQKKTYRISNKIIEF